MQPRACTLYPDYRVVDYAVPQDCGGLPRVQTELLLAPKAPRGSAAIPEAQQALSPIVPGHNELRRRNAQEARSRR